MTLPLFVALLAALFHVTQLHLEQLMVLGEARQAAWTHALQGCRGRSETAGTVSASAVSELLAARGESIPSASAGYATAVGGDAVTGRLSSARATARTEVDGVALLRLPSAQLSGQAALPCNERPRPGSLTSAVSYGWDAVRFW